MRRLSREGCRTARAATQRAGCKGSKNGGRHNGPALKQRGQKIRCDRPGDQAADEGLPRNERAPRQADRGASESAEDADQHRPDKEGCRDGNLVQHKGEDQ